MRSRRADRHRARLGEPGTKTFQVVVPDADVGYSSSPGADGVERVDATHVYWASTMGIR